MGPEGNVYGTTPFRVGTTSYIMPDDIVPNLTFLAGMVDDVELVLFESYDGSNLPSNADVERMRDMAQEHRLSFTVHFPLDLHLGGEDERLRRHSVDMCLRIIERMSPLEPFAWILHLEGDQRGDPPSKNVSRWQSQHGRSVERLTASVEEARTICVESLDYEFSLVGQIIREHDTGVCLDVGHLLQTGREVQPHWDAWADRIGVVHLHGVRPDGTDHVDVSYLPPGFLEAMIGLLKQEPALERVLTLEVFAADDFYTSVEVLKRCLATPTG